MRGTHHIPPASWQRMSWPVRARFLAAAEKANRPATATLETPYWQIRDGQSAPDAIRVALKACPGGTPADLAGMTGLNVHTVRRHLPAIRKEAA